MHAFDCGKGLNKLPGPDNWTWDDSSLFHVKFSFEPKSDRQFLIVVGSGGKKEKSCKQ